MSKKTVNEQGNENAGVCDIVSDFKMFGDVAVIQKKNNRNSEQEY